VLTGLANRRYLDRRLPFEIQQARERGRPLSVGLLDVDHFGGANKDHGWPSGDKILDDTAARIRDALRASDWAARYGGEEILDRVLAGLAGRYIASIVEIMIDNRWGDRAMTPSRRA
jgi:diguanylate cyclase (GGDEF)-like protein